ncbi:MAG TPA: CBS domain-containing protein [Ktedonobacteraceae bacterium]|jgi:CBS domain-containing protein|nr:CBS domain-containing protein [Ktedonobacteraceae bacterium]HZU68747.1 CBS domain-containing protein [Ktedonobacteraceae bacterium]
MPLLTSRAVLALNWIFFLPKKRRLGEHEGQVILDYSKEQHCDLLVLGHQGHSGVWGAFLGGTADKLISQGPVTVRQVMRPRLFAVTPAAPVLEAVRIMLVHQIKRLVVVDDGGKPLKFVDRQQLLRSLIEGAPF